jgi:hypothetical protein
MSFPLKTLFSSDSQIIFWIIQGIFDTWMETWKFNFCNNGVESSSRIFIAGFSFRSGFPRILWWKIQVIFLVIKYWRSEGNGSFLDHLEKALQFPTFRDPPPHLLHNSSFLKQKLIKRCFLKYSWLQQVSHSTQTNNLNLQKKNVKMLITFIIREHELCG